MRTKTRINLAIILAGLVGCAWFVAWPNDLGLTRLDLLIGGRPDVEALRVDTKKVADAYLVQHHSDLSKLCGGPYELSVNDSLTRMARSLGYRSSYYYSRWDIYRPYSLTSDRGEHLVLVQVNGTRPGNFEVLRAFVIDSDDQVTLQLE